MNAWSSAGRGVARHPVLAFMLISLGIGFVTAAIPPIADSEIPPFDQPLHGIVGGCAGCRASCLPGHGRVVGPCGCRGPRTS